MACVGAAWERASLRIDGWIDSLESELVAWGRTDLSVCYDWHSMRNIPQARVEPVQP